MIKKLKNCFIVILFYCFFTSSIALGQTPSSTASSSPTVVVDKDIQQLKDKIANKVSEIRKQNNKAISGFVLKIDGNSMKLSNSGEVNQVKFDDTLTKVFKHPIRLKQSLDPDLIGGLRLTIAGKVIDA